MVLDSLLARQFSLAAYVEQRNPGLVARFSLEKTFVSYTGGGLRLRAPFTRKQAWWSAPSCPEIHCAAPRGPLRRWAASTSGCYLCCWQWQPSQATASITGSAT